MPKNPKQLYHFTHSSPEIKTVADLLNNPNSPAFLYNTDPNGFLNIVGEDGRTNRERIEATFTFPEYKRFIGAPFSKLPLLNGTLLFVEYEKVNKPSFLTEGITVISNNEPAFKAAKLAELEADLGYYQIDKPLHGKLALGVSKEIYPDVSVWVWCAALSPRGEESTELSGEFFNLSPFIEKITTNMTKNGGNFSIKLPPLVCELDSETNKWIIKKGALVQYSTNNNSSLQGDGYLAEGSLYTTEIHQDNPNVASDEVLTRSQFFFHNIIQPNDLVLIRFETLEMEKEQRYADAQSYYINKNNIANQLYDMIGLVDSNTIMLSPSNNDVSINISGRDLSKLVIEDGTYFYALENSQGTLKFAGQSTEKNSLLKRIFADNGMSFIGLYQFTSIEYILKFIIQQLSSIKIVPDDLFRSYAQSIKKINGKDVIYDSRNRYFTDYDIKGADAKLRTELKDKATLKVEQLRAAAGRTTPNLGAESKLREDIFYEMVNFLEEIRKYNYRQINDVNKTAGWKAFTYKGERIDKDTFPEYFAKNLLNDKGDINEDLFRFLNICDQFVDAGKQEKVFKEQLARGIWQIINLVIDETVASRRLADVSFSTANGSLLNFLKAACQDPLVEFYSDTYGDKYHWIVRKPPYDQKGLITLIEGKVNTEEGIPNRPPSIVDVEQEDILSESLTYDDNQVHSWYQFTPKNALIGDAQDYALSYLPAFYFPEYAEVYGSKPLQQSHSYLNYVPLKNSKDEALSDQELQVFEDMRYVIESNQYLPFTRKGQITLNRDRRLKVGNIMRYKATGEIFFIDAVQHNYQINDSNLDATTTINVSRGMIEQLIYGQYVANENGGKEFVSYFNIIDTRLVFNKHEVTKEVTRRVKKKKKVTVIKPDEGTSTTALSFMLDNFIHIAQVIEKGNNTGIGNLNTYNQYPKNKQTFINFINLINASGYWVHVGALSANRTYAQQAALKRENDNNASPGHSNHERGAAIDITLTDKKSGRVHSKTTDKAAWIATGVPAIARSLGLRWANGEGSFGSYIDRVHFEIASAPSNLEVSTEDEYEETTETQKSMVIDKAGVFQNFRVNKFVFNFFRKRLQQSPEYKYVTSRKIYDNGGQVLPNVTIQSTKKLNG